MSIKILGYVLAIGIGLSLGLIGGGGSILAVPILVYVMGVGSREAIAMSLFVVGSVSLLGAIPYARRRHISWRMVAGFTPAAMAGAYLGSQLVKLPLITDTVQLASFGMVMLIASLLMILNGKAPLSQSSLERSSVTNTSLENPSSKTFSSARSPNSNLLTWLAMSAQGLGVGIVTGFVGVGGGFLIIPALVLLSQLPMKTAVGTSLLIIALNSATGFAGYINQVAIDWPMTLAFTLVAGFGTLIGTQLSQAIEASKLQKGFGYFVLAVAVFVLVKR